ncbi:MAG: DUF523 and DUF1722 domain-containing protein [Magnetococcales bacterium]|nr:DUF523 and DUF1722 domain-containing protein [Magnetococcales bacterium]
MSDRCAVTIQNNQSIPRMFISGCLAGEWVRYDGGQQFHSVLINQMGRLVEWLPICPEFEAGLGLPREPIQLEGDPHNPAVRAVVSRRDMTDCLQKWAHEKGRVLDEVRPWGVVLKSRSPSCGVRDVKVVSVEGTKTRDGVGCFSGWLSESRPMMPLAQETDLSDFWRWQGFAEWVFIYQRWQRVERESLQRFHQRHKYQLMARHAGMAKALGRVAATAVSHAESIDDYCTLLARMMRLKSSRLRHVNALKHVAGYLPKKSRERAEAHRAIDHFSLGQRPLASVQMTLYRLASQKRLSYLQNQYYLKPDPLQLRIQRLGSRKQ